MARARRGAHRHRAWPAADRIRAALDRGAQFLGRFVAARVGVGRSLSPSACAPARVAGLRGLRAVVEPGSPEVGLFGRDGLGRRARLRTLGLAELPDVRRGVLHPQQPGAGAAHG